VSDAPLPVLTLPGSALARIAEAEGVPVVREAFVDRGYRADGTLIPRAEPGALLHDLDEITDRAIAFVRDGRCDSLCVHGDTPNAVAMATAVRDALIAEGISIAPFARVST